MTVAAVLVMVAMAVAAQALASRAQEDRVRLEAALQESEATALAHAASLASDRGAQTFQELRNHLCVCKARCSMGKTVVNLPLPQTCVYVYMHAFMHALHMYTCIHMHLQHLM